MRYLIQIAFCFISIVSLNAQSDTISSKRFFLTPEFGISISSMPESSSFYYKVELVSFPIGTNFCYLPFEKKNIYFKTGINSIKRGGYHYFPGYENYRIITNYIDIPLNVGFYSNKKTNS